ncbi:histone-lysine N-methyltransferase 2C-like isoform X15 [Palaemon carinicauda]|uniref:histone-lysine N-methyltransferase 2C-like isoform X15 n=1 Tax=Palaemon carinicauda TaxID=392227 RepID=UPI0035B635B9
MERPHGGSCRDGSPDDKHDKGTTNGSELSSCGSSVGPKSLLSNSLGGGVEEKMEVDSPLLLPTLASLPSTSSVTITKATSSQPRSSHSPSSSSSPPPPPPPPPPSSSSAVSTHSSVVFTSVSTSSSSTSHDVMSNINNGLLGPDMMPTIPLVPVQVPTGRGGVVTIPKARGRPKGMPFYTPRGGFQIRKGMKIKRIGMRGRGGRRLVHSMSLEERGAIGGDDSPLPLDEEAYAQDDMIITPSYQEKWSGRFCALCNLGEQSQLGQGDLIRHEPTSGFVLPEKFEVVDTEECPSKKFKLNHPTHPTFLKRHSEILRTHSPMMLRFPTSKAVIRDKGKSPRKQIGDLILPEPVDEISLVGHQEQPSVGYLFESGGHCLVHYMCGLWSSNVELTSDDIINKVDIAVVAGASQRCASCKKFGATIPCKVPGCPKYYHFPCAMYDGAPMDLKSVAMVCPSHADRSRDILVDMACMICEHSSPESSLIFCSNCGNHYHGMCLKPPLTAVPAVRTGWQCPDCKMCQMCRQPSDDLVCGVCDKAYHMVCARPFGLSLLKTGWKCKTCRACGDCGSRTPGNGMSSRWHANFTVCDSCYQLRNKGLACPICRKAYRAIAQKTMAQCCKCKKHVHSGCDPDADLGLIQSKYNADRTYEYICTSCNRVAPSPNQSPQVSQEDSCDGPQGSSIHSEDSNDMDLTPEGKYEEYSTISKSQGSSYFSRGKPVGLARRGGFAPRLRGGTIGKCSPGKKAFSNSRKRGQTLPIRRGRGGGRGYRGYFNYQNISQVMEVNHGTGKEEGEENKVILISAKDEFCLEQDVCAMCGAFGQDQEGRLIACAQCGQCYHPYCANVKDKGTNSVGDVIPVCPITRSSNSPFVISEPCAPERVTKVVLQKGWRCLDCTVCEGCGERNDEARLVLCEDCDISYHIYCMNPPLDQVPSGVWRCKWCAICHYCGATDPGPNSTWQQNYSMCGPCMSMTQCPVCDEQYADGELIIQCTNCERWLHASDDMIHTEEDAERCAGKGYLCLICRPQDALPPHLLPHTPPMRRVQPPQPPVPVTTAPPSPVRPPSPSDIMTKVTSKAQFWIDGICLSECGVSQIKTQTIEPQKKPRNPKTVRTSRGPSIDSSGSRDVDDDDDDDEEKLDDEPRHWVYGMKEGTILQAKEDGTPPDLPDGFYTLPGPEPGTYTLRKRRYRNIKTLGIGGFQVRARGKKDEEKAKEEAALDPQVLELRRKRSNWRTKKKIKLLEKFPSYIQEAFFGRNLMDTSNLEEEMKQINGLDEELDEDVFDPQKPKSAITLSKDEVQLVQAAQNKQHGRVDGASQNIKLSSPQHIKSEDTLAQERKDSIDKKENDEEMAEEDENNEAIDAIFASGRDFTDIFMSDIIINDPMKDDDTGDEDLSQDNIDVPGAGGNGTKLTDILGPGFNLEDVADIIKDLPEDSTEDSQDSMLSSMPTSSALSGGDGGSAICMGSEVNVSPNVSPTTSHPVVNVVSTANMPMPPSVPRTLPAASTLRPNQPPVAPLGIVPTGSLLPVGPPVPSLPTVPLSNSLQVQNSVPSIKSPVGLPNPITMHNPVAPHPPPPTMQPTTHPSPMAGCPPSIPQSLPQSLPSPLSRADSQSSPIGYPTTPTTTKPSTPSVPEPQKVWTSDNQSQSLSLEEDESLGAKATKAAVLYVNVHKPNLKNEYPSVPDRERQIRRIWKNLKDTEQKKMLIQTARENKKEYYKNKQEQQRALKNSESLEASTSSSTSIVPGSITERGNSADPSPVNTPQASPRPALPSLTPPRPLMIPQRSQLPHGSPTIRQSLVHTHTMVRGAVSHVQGPSDHYAHAPMTPRPQLSPLPSPTNDPYARVPGTPRPHTSDPYSVAPATPRPVPSDPYGMPPPTPRPIDPFASQGGPPRPNTSDPFTSSPSESFNQPPASPYVQAPPTPRPHDDGYGQPQTPGPPSGPMHGDPVRQQHLRELLQRQQSRPWNEGSNAHQTSVQPPLSSPELSGEFRQPLPPVVQGQGIRMRSPSIAQGKPGMSSHPAAPGQGPQMDPRVRMIFQRGMPPQQQTVISRNTVVDPYAHLVQRPPQQYLTSPGNPAGIRPGIQNVVRGPPGTITVSQGAGSPHMSQSGPVPGVPSTHHQQQQQQQPPPPPPPHPLGPPHSHPPVSHSQLLQQSRPPPPQPSHMQQPRTNLLQQPQSQAPQPQQQAESELPEAVTRELEQLEEEQQQQQHQQPSADTQGQGAVGSGPPPGSQHPASNQGDDLDDLAPGDLPNMEDDLLVYTGIGGDFNALLEFADGGVGEEDDKLPSNLFDELGDEDDESHSFRRKREKSGDQGSARGSSKERIGLSGTIPVGPPSSESIMNSHPSVSPSQGQHAHPINRLGLGTGMNDSPSMPTSGSMRHEHHGLEHDTLQMQPHQRPSVTSMMDPPGPSHIECSTVNPSSVVSVGPSSGSPIGPPPGPIMGPVRMPITSSQQLVQPQMAPHLTQTAQRFPGMGNGIARIGAPRGVMIRQPAPPPPPYPGHHPPPPPYPRSQPLLIEDLLEQEKQEQLKHHKTSHQQHQEVGPDGLLSEVDFEKLKADVLSNNPSVGLQSISGPPIPNAPGVRPTYQRLVGPPAPAPGQTVYHTQGPAQPLTRPVRPQGDPGMHPALIPPVTSRAPVPSSPATIRTIPPPPQPPDNPHTEADRQTQIQYEQWLTQQHNCIVSQQRYYEAEITKLRKQRKSLNSRQRTLKKNGQELNETDAAELSRIQREASTIQRQLEQCRKSARQHAMIMQEYNTKKRPRQPHMLSSQGGVISGSQGAMMSGASPLGPTGSSPMHSTPQSPLMSPSPSSQPGMGLSPMVPSPAHTPVASPAAVVPQHSPHGMVVPGPHHSPGESPFSPQTRMPSPGGGYPDPGPRACYPGTPQGIPHHMIGPQMRVRMPVHSPGTQTVSPGPISPHMMNVRPAYSQPGVMLQQGQGPSMMMRHQYSQGVMPLRRPSGSGPVPSPGSVGPIPSPSGPVPSPLGSGMAMKPSPVHSGLKSPVPLASPSSAGPVPSPMSGGMTMKPSPVHSGLRSPAPLASPQMRPHSVENPSTPLTPRSGADIGAAPHTPHSDVGGASSSGSQVNSPHPSIPTPTSDAVPSPVPSSTPTPSAAATLGLRTGGGGGGNANNPYNPVPLPPHFGRFGFFKLGLRGGSLIRSRWGHFKIGLKGGAPLGEIENSGLQPVSSSTAANVVTTSASSVTNTIAFSLSNRAPSASSSPVKSDPEGDEGQEGLAHVLSESVKGPVVRMPMIGGGPRVSQAAYASAGSTLMTPHMSTSANRVVVPEPLKSEIPPSSRHQAVIGIPGGGAISQGSMMYQTHGVTVAPGIRSTVSTVNYPSVTGHGSVPFSSPVSGVSLSVGTTQDSTSCSSLIPPSVMSVTSTSSIVSQHTEANILPISQAVSDVSTYSTMVSLNDHVSGLTNYANTSLPMTMVSSATTHTTPALGRPLVSIPVQHIGLQQQTGVHISGAPVITSTQPMRTLPSIGHIGPPVARQFRTQLMRAPVSPHGVTQENTHHVVSQQQVIHQPVSQQLGLQSSDILHTVGQQGVIQTTSGSSPLGSIPQTVRMVQPMMVQQTRVMVRPGVASQVGVPGVRMMMIHGGPVRTPSPPVNRPAMMPPPAAKSPAGHSASPIPRVSPAQSPLSNHPSPHSPQVKGQSPMMGSPTPSPHNSLPTPPGMLKKELDDDRPRSCGTPQQTSCGSATLQTLNVHNLPPVTCQTQPSTQIPGMSNANITAQNTTVVSGPLKSENLGEGLSKESSNALLKQLLENTGCASPMQPPSQGQLLVFRSTPMPSSHLSQVASQLPNPTPIMVPRSVVTTLQGGSQATVLNSNTATVIQQSSEGQQQQQHSVITPAAPHQLGPGPQLMHRSVVVSSGLHPGQQVPGGHTVVLSQQQPLPSHSGIVRTGIPYASQHDPTSPHTTVSHPSSQLISVRQVTAHHPSHPVINPSGHHPPQGQPPHPSVNVTHSSHPVAHHTSTHVVVHPGLRATHPAQQHQIPSSHPPGTHIIQGSRPVPPLSTNSVPTPASVADRINNNPALKTEMRVMIPETVVGTGASTGEHTPEMTTPNEGSDSLDPEELKKAKKRAQQARRKSQSKDTKVQPAKRARQGSRVEEDYETYIDGIMQQLRSMPPLTIMEPEVPRNFNLCPIFGSGDLIKLGRRDYNHRQGVLEGTEGHATVKNIADYYNTQPFGDKLPIVTPAKTGPTQRGFYIHEFTPPKIGLPLDEYQDPEAVTTTNTSRPTAAPTPTRDSDSPDTVLSSSSPECILPESPIPFKGLRLVDMDDDQDDHRDRSLSPAIPLLIPVPIRPGQLPFFPSEGKDTKDIPELDKENIGSLASITMKSRIGQSPALPLKDKGNVTVTLTLSSQAGDDVSGVLRSLANLLNIPPPTSYQMTDQFEAPNLPRLYHHKHHKDGKEQIIDIQSILNGQARFCRHCDVIIERDILSKRVADLPFLSKEDYGSIEEVTFCSQHCYIQFAISHRVVVEEKIKPEGMRYNKGRDSFGDITKDSISKLCDPGMPDWPKEEGLDEVLKVPQLEDSLHSRPNKHKLEDDQEQFPRQADGKRFRGHKYKYWTPNALTLPEDYEKPTPKEMTDLLFRMCITYRKPRLRDDSRQCTLCKLYGDYVADGPSRLLNYDVDKWVHLNCALWLEEVYETMNGALMNVDSSMKKILSHFCEHCEQPGASVKCFKVRCSKMYHLNCAVKEGCTFYKNKTVFCQEHINKGEKDNELSTLAVFRRVFIDREDNRQVASVMHNADSSYILRIGSLTLLSIGQLLPNQLQAFHTPYCIYPVGYQVVRFYWSMRRLHKRCAYECSIHEKDGQPEFHIIVREEGFEDHMFVSCSPKGVWNKVLEPIAEMRQKADVVRLFPQYISGEDLFGLNEPAIVRILESLPGIDTLADYNFKYGRNPLFELPLAVNPTGCARSEPFNKLHLKRYHGIRTNAGSVRNSGNCRTAASIASLTMTFDPFVSYSKLHVHSRSSQYKKMKNEWRSVVYLARSKIQGLGLYAARDIEKNTMIIEYIGEIIRSELAEVREKRYEAQNRGIYMFRLDDQRVVDATVTGGLARYINHSCGPNCYTETIEVERDLKILIISNRKIIRGEELAYDYKFDEEEDHKIPCLCGAENCRKWMN